MSGLGKSKSLLRAASVVGSFTLLSRIFGFLRDLIIANYFGTRAAADAFFVAFRIPNLLRRLTAEGALSAAFIPLFAKTLQADRKKAIRFANNLLAVMTMVLTLIVVVGILFSPQLLSVIAVGFTDDPQKFELTVLLTRLLFPYLLFVSLAAIVMGILNTMHHFAAPAASPVVFNIAIIASVIFLRDMFELPVYAIVAGVLIGGVLQLAIQIPYAIREGFSFFPHVDFKSELLKKVFLLTLPATAGFAVAEINMFVDTILASLLAEGSVSYLYYGNRLMLFPLGIFGAAMSTALLPTLSFQAGEKDFAKMVETISKSLRAMSFLIVPSTVGLIALREPIVKILFERGEFDNFATVNTGIALGYYSAGLIAFAGVKVAVAGFYALGDTKTPVKVASLAMVLNIIFNLILMGPLKHGGLALATSLASVVNFFLLLYLLDKRLGGIDGKKMLKTFALATLASLMMGGLIATLSMIISPFTVVGLTVVITGSALFYFLVTWLIDMEEIHYVYEKVSKKLRG